MQSVYVQVYVFVPPQVGLGPMTGPVTDSAVPHEFVTVGFAGVVAFALQATVEEPFAGIVNVGGDIV